MRRSSISSKDKMHGKRTRAQQSRIEHVPSAVGPRQTRTDRNQTSEKRVAKPQQEQQVPQQQQTQQGQPQAVKAAPIIQTPNFRLLLNRPQAIVIDLLGVLVCRSFMTSSKEFRDFLQHNVLEYLNDNWKQKPLRIMVNFFRCSQQNIPDDYKLADREESREDQIRQARKHVIWRLRNDPTNSALSLFMLGITEWGYKNRLLQTPVYEEVPYMLKCWKEQLKIPVYVGVGSADFLVMVLSSTTYGNLLQYFHGHMNIMDFDGTMANKDFKKLSNLLTIPPDKILYLTRFRQDCRRAMESGMQSLIVLRQDFDTHGLIKELKAKRTNMAAADGTRIRLNNTDETTSPPSGRQIADVKNTYLRKQFEENISSLSLIEDHEDTDRYNNQSSAIVEHDLTRYNIVLSLSEITFK